jgi:acetyl-CoA C-acetyltransferase
VIDRRAPVLVATARTPVGRFGGALAHLTGTQLGGVAVRGALERAGDLEVDQVLMGNVVQAGNGQNPARVAGVRGGLPTTVPAVTFNDVCLASMTATGVAATMIRSGEISSAVVGGFESMSQAPHGARIRGAARVGNTEMVDLLVNDGLSCALTHQGMGPLSDAENERLGVPRTRQDEFAVASHIRAAEAAGRLAREILPVDGVELTADEGVRPDTSAHRLAQLRPAFTPEGTITAGNASQMSDAGAAGVLTSAERARALGHSNLVEIVARAVVAGPDASLHLKPAAAIARLLKDNGLTVDDVGVWEINEAFAGVVLASCAELNLDPAKVNRDGGAVAIGHPLGASAFRLVMTAARQLTDTGQEWAVASLCGGGGQGQAMLLRSR